jgi:hypothetical protein
MFHCGLFRRAVFRDQPFRYQPFAKAPVSSRHLAPRRIHKTYTRPTQATSASGSTHAKLTANRTVLQRFARFATRFSLVCHRAATVQAQCNICRIANRSKNHRRLKAMP